MEDLYSVLGVSKAASSDEIKKAYRNLAFQYHPDRNAGNKTAEELFKKINEAYSVLGDETKRRQYDQYAADGFSSGSRSQSQDPFADFFGGGSYQNQGNYRYTYTYTARNAERPSKSFSFMRFCLSVFQVIFCFFGFRTVGRWSFVFSVIFFLGMVSGIKNAAGNLKWIFAE